MDPFNALLVEGVPGVGKSTLVDALIRRHVSRAGPRQIRTLVHLSQAHTYGPLAPAEDAGTLTPAENREHLGRVVGAIEWLRAGVRDHQRQSCFVIVDTLHLTHCVRPGVIAWGEAAAFDRRLASAGCGLLMLRASAEVVRERSVEARADWPFLREYAAKFGRTPDELHEYFVREQERLLEMFRRSAMRKLLVPNDGALADVVDGAYEFWRGARDAAAEGRAD